MSWKFGAILFFWGLGNAILWAQDNTAMSIPAAIYIEDSYTFEPQAGVKVQLHIKKPDGTSYRYGEYTSNAEGMIPLSLLPQTVYQISSRKAKYYSQLTLLETQELSRTGKNRFNISLRPKSCYRLQGQIHQEVGEKSFFELTDASTGVAQRVRIFPDGRYYACGECGTTYYLTAQINGEIQQPDTIYLDPIACTIQRRPIMNLDFQPRPPLPSVKEIPQPEKPVERGAETYIPAVNDSLIVENLVFEGKTKRLDAAGEAVLLELMDALVADEDLVVELLVHTDARKSERYNWLLAERRAALIEQYLEDKNIDSRRYRILPIGEQKILNHCTNGKRCSITEHRVNNRVELIRHPNGELFSTK